MSRAAPGAAPRADPGGRLGARRARTRRALVEAAERLFAENGVGAVSVDEIVASADVAKGTFYNHFADKDSLARLVEEATRRDLEGRIGAVNDGVTDAAARVARALCCAMVFGLAEPVRARTMMRMFPHAADPAAPLNQGVRLDVRLGVEAARFRVPSEEAAIVFVVGAVQAALSRTLDLADASAPATAAATRALATDIGLMLLTGLGIPPREAVRLVADAAAGLFTG